MAVDSRSPGQFVNNCPISLEPTAIITHENATAFSNNFFGYFFSKKSNTRPLLRREIHNNLRNM